MSTCPRCNSDANGENRLVTDSCGHKKCRRCLLADVSSCYECKNASLLYKPLQTEAADETGINSNHITTNEQGHHCNACNKSFRSRTQLYYHRGCGNELLKKYACNQCTRRFATRSHLNYHLAGHAIHGSHTCNVCEKTFKQPLVMQRHMRVHKLEVYKCPLCEKQFRSSSALRAHSAVHSGNDLPYQCEICPRRYLTKANLKQHQLKHDQHSPKHSCVLCHKSFVRQSTLKLHMKRHNTRERHPCTQCNKSFTDADALVRHIKQHASTEKYRCVQCDISVKRRDNMLRHMRVMHPGVSFSEGVEIVNIANALNDTVPAGVRYSSVIKSVGNVQPVVVATESIEHCEPTTVLPDETQRENVKLYRKIILDLDNEEYSNETVSVQTEHEQLQATPIQRVSTHPSSNFSEMHWRKNFKFSYENEHVN